MKLERVSAGEYRVASDKATVRLQRQLNRAWAITAAEGITFEPKQALSYSDAKIEAERILRGPRHADFVGGPAERAGAALERAAPRVPSMAKQLADELRKLAGRVETVTH